MQIDARPRYYPVELQRQNTYKTAGVTTDTFGLRLAGNIAKPTYSPLAMDSLDGSVGRRTLPKGFAIDSQLRCYFAQRATGDIWFFDSAVPTDSESPFRCILNFPFSERVPTDGTPVKQAAKPAILWSLAANATSLFIVRPGHRGVTTVALDYWAVQEIECFSSEEWAIDVATHNDTVYVLTDRAIYERCNAADGYRKMRPVKDGRRLLIGTSGDVFVCLIKTLPSGKPGLSIENVTGYRAFDRTVVNVPTVTTHPAPHTESNFQYIIPACLTSPCARQLPATDAKTPPELAATALTWEMLESADLRPGFLISEDGRRVRKESFRPSTNRLFVTGMPQPEKDDKGSQWFSTAIDSHRYHCRWDRVELDVEIPQGCRVVVSTQTFDLDQDNRDVRGTASESADSREAVTTELEVSVTLQRRAENSPDTNWSPGARFECELRRTPTIVRVTRDFLVRSEPGRFLCLRVQLFGDGFSTPVVRSILAKGPRQSHIDFLPAVMRSDDLSRDFLERFVSVFQTEWDQLEETIDQMDGMFNPALVPDSHLDQLAEWMGISLPVGWKREQCRDLLKFAPQLLMAPGNEHEKRIGGSRRGTVEHIRNAVRAVIGGLKDLNEDQMRGFPWVIEGFRERNQFRVGGRHGTERPMAGDQVSPPMARTLWGPDSTGRLQLGDNSVLGERKLLPTGRQELDLYRTYAHRIRVVVPACWISGPDDLCVLESMINKEKPAHLACDITLVRPGLRIGVQSTVGVDTILSDWPPVVLAGNTVPTLGLGQGIVLSGSTDRRPPPLPVDGTLGHHVI